MRKYEYKLKKYEVEIQYYDDNRLFSPETIRIYTNEFRCKNKNNAIAQATISLGEYLKLWSSLNIISVKVNLKRGE